jgi:hypothetical protein
MQLHTTTDLKLIAAMSILAKGFKETTDSSRRKIWESKVPSLAEYKLPKTKKARESFNGDTLDFMKSVKAYLPDELKGTCLVS